MKYWASFVTNLTHFTFKTVPRRKGTVFDDDIPLLYLFYKAVRFDSVQSVVINSLCFHMKTYIC